jgi:hypothetical protein
MKEYKNYVVVANILEGMRALESGLQRNKGYQKYNQYIPLFQEKFTEEIKNIPDGNVQKSERSLSCEYIYDFGLRDIYRFKGYQTAKPENLMQGGSITFTIRKEKNDTLPKTMKIGKAMVLTISISDIIKFSENKELQHKVIYYGNLLWEERKHYKALKFFSPFNYSEGKDQTFRGMSIVPDIIHKSTLREDLLKQISSPGVRFDSRIGRQINKFGAPTDARVLNWDIGPNNCWESGDIFNIKQPTEK